MGVKYEDSLLVAMFLADTVDSISAEESPDGCVVKVNGQVIVRDYNSTVLLQDVINPLKICSEPRDFNYDPLICGCAYGIYMCAKEHGYPCSYPEYKELILPGPTNNRIQMRELGDYKIIRLEDNAGVVILPNGEVAVIADTHRRKVSHQLHVIERSLVESGYIRRSALFRGFMEMLENYAGEFPVVSINKVDCYCERIGNEVHLISDDYGVIRDDEVSWSLEPNRWVFYIMYEVMEKNVRDSKCSEMNPLKACLKRKGVRDYENAYGLIVKLFKSTGREDILQEINDYLSSVDGKEE